MYWFISINEVKEKGFENMLTDEWRQDILDSLCINYFSRKHIYNIIMQDNVMNIFNKPNYIEFKMLFEYRRFKTTYILILQSLKGIAP